MRKSETAGNPLKPDLENSPKVRIQLFSLNLDRQLLKLLSFKMKN